MRAADLCFHTHCAGFEAWLGSECFAEDLKHPLPWLHVLLVVGAGAFREALLQFRIIQEQATLLHQFLGGIKKQNIAAIFERSG
jgi:hypothetical protein